MTFLPLKRARIVTDRYAGYEVQLWRWWFPVWLQAWGTYGMTNTHSKVADAEEFARQCLLGPKKKPVKRSKLVKEVQLDRAALRTQSKE